eukprot:TRINITY_DN9775_c0_g1_i1.p1 TRINITY_DN9775_c0_g1~~TRINITY_DN9775_c0_g1_i1.p1  ORF type:complete len:510 (-),score=81.60 TRINITY_DN9775_c0_g1_i1:58-1554(-)
MAEPKPNVFGFYTRGDCCQHEALASPADLEACLQRWEACDKAKLLRLVLKGIPNDMRARFWRVAADLDNQRRQYQGIYKDLLRREVPAQVERDIEVDLGRTMVGHADFDKCSEKEQALARVMRAFATYRPELSYSQGMSFLAATLLIYFPDEEDAFWMFVTLLERRGIGHLYDKQFANLTTLCECAAARLPKKLGAHVNSTIGLACYVTNWALTLFVASFPCWASVLLIWDLLWIVENPEHFLISLVLAIHKHFQGHIMEETGVSLMSFLMQKLPGLVHVSALREMLPLKVLQELPPKDGTMNWSPSPCPSPAKSPLVKKVSLQYLTNKLKENRSPRLPISPLPKGLRSGLTSPSKLLGSGSRTPGSARKRQPTPVLAPQSPVRSHPGVLQPSSPNLRQLCAARALGEPTVPASPEASPTLMSFSPCRVAHDAWVPSPLPSPALKRLSSAQRRWSGGFEDAAPGSPPESPTSGVALRPLRHRPSPAAHLQRSPAHAFR